MTTSTPSPRTELRQDILEARRITSPLSPDEPIFVLRWHQRDMILALLDEAESAPAGGLRAAAEKTADWLAIVQATYHAVAQNMPVETRSTCEAGMCGDYREHRDLLRAALDAALTASPSASPLDVGSEEAK